MSGEVEESLYLLTIRFGGDEPIYTHLEESLPIIQRLLDKFSDGRYMVSFKSLDCGLIGFLLVTNQWALHTLRQIVSPGRDYVVTPLDGDRETSHTSIEWANEIDTSPIQLGDQVYVYELAYDHATRGANTIPDWIAKTDPR